MLPIELDGHKIRVLQFCAVIAAGTVLSGATAGITGAVVGVAQGIFATELQNRLVCSSKLLQDRALNEVAGNAIANILYHIAETDRFLDYKQNLIKIAKNASSFWLKIIHIEGEEKNPKYSDIQPNALPALLQNCTALDPETWEYILRWLGASVEINLPADVIHDGANELWENFPVALRKALADASTKDNPAYAEMNLILVGEIIAGISQLQALQLQTTSNLESKLNEITNCLQQLLGAIASPNYPAAIAAANAPTISSKKIVISYGNESPDIDLAQKFYQSFTSIGYEAFLAEQIIQRQANWPQVLEAKLASCDYLVLLLSQQSITSEMVAKKLQRVTELRATNSSKKPVVLPIRVNLPLEMPLNYEQRLYLEKIPQRLWQTADDTPTILREVITLISTGEISAPSWTVPHPTLSVLPDLDLPPLPVAEPELRRIPGGTVPLNSGLYIERPPIESDCYEEVLQPGALIRIKAARQMGKTSLMSRILAHAREEGYQTVNLSLQRADSNLLENLDQFLLWFCQEVGRSLGRLDQLDSCWSKYVGKSRCSFYFEECLLEPLNTPLVLGLDEVDRVFTYQKTADEFFALLRSWFEAARSCDRSSIFWEKLRLVIVHSTEVYIPKDINQSPFNMGITISLPEFNLEQVEELVKRYKFDFAAIEIKQLMDLVGGNPYLVNLALFCLSDRQLNFKQFLSTATTDEGIYQEHLRHYLQILGQEPKLATEIKRLIKSEEPVELEFATAYKLEAMGLIKFQTNKATIKYKLYREYFKYKL